MGKERREVRERTSRDTMESLSLSLSPLPPFPFPFSPFCSPNCLPLSSFSHHLLFSPLSPSSSPFSPSPLPLSLLPPLPRLIYPIPLSSHATDSPMLPSLPGMVLFRSVLNSAQSPRAQLSRTFSRVNDPFL